RSVALHPDRSHSITTTDRRRCHMYGCEGSESCGQQERKLRETACSIDRQRIEVKSHAGRVTNHVEHASGRGGRNSGAQVPPPSVAIFYAPACAPCAAGLNPTDSTVSCCGV